MTAGVSASPIVNQENSKGTIVKAQLQSETTPRSYDKVSRFERLQWSYRVADQHLCRHGRLISFLGMWPKGG
jgi:hypothetical protein